jgi:hypothetical protein
MLAGGIDWSGGRGGEDAGEGAGEGVARGQEPAVSDDLLTDDPQVSKGGAQRGEVTAEPVEAQVAAGPVEDVIRREVVPLLGVILPGDRLVASADQARLLDLPRQSVVLAEDETHLNLLPHVRASWTLRAMRPQVLTPGTNRKVTVLGALEVSTGLGVPAGPPLRGGLHRAAWTKSSETRPAIPSVSAAPDG